MSHRSKKPASNGERRAACQPAQCPGPHQSITTTRTAIIRLVKNFIARTVTTALAGVKPANCFSVKGQIVIPRRIRKEFEIEKGTRAYVESPPEGILIKPVTPNFVRGLRGKYKDLPWRETLQQIEREEKEIEMATKVLDSRALMAFFKGEPAGEVVEAISSTRPPMKKPGCAEFKEVEKEIKIRWLNGDGR
jgi:AbrB family looped-hinge helix DNA binding protein